MISRASPSPSRSRRRLVPVALGPLAALAACQSNAPLVPSPSETRAPSASATPPATPMEPPQSEWTPIPAGDPAKTEVSFAAGAGWQGTLVLDNGGVGVWTLAVLKMFDAYGCPEIVGLDDKGRCQVLWSYSGKWTPVPTVHDGTWLGGIAQADVDPRVPGTELYVGAQSGNIYEVVTYPDRAIDHRRIARVPGREIHTLLAGEIDASSPGPEIIAFTNPGAVVRVKPRSPERDGFDVEVLAEIDGRVRDACALPQVAGRPREFATVMRTGNVSILTFTEKGPVFTPVIEIGMGMGRLAINADAPPERPVIYSTADDGRVYRSERGADGRWSNEMIYAGPQGMRGCTWGHFDADRSVETIAVHGYSHCVELLSKVGGKWKRETLFVDRDKGHWLAAGELDGRNATDEIVCSGYSGRVVLLARPPGHGLKGVLSVEPAR